jgi:hypothetical protein
MGAMPVSMYNSKQKVLNMINLVTYTTKASSNMLTIPFGVLWTRFPFNHSRTNLVVVLHDEFLCACFSEG